MSLRRRVPVGRREEYGALWKRLHTGATARGAHAWRFRSAGDDELHLEFLEFAAGEDPRPASEVAEALRALDAAFPASPPSAPPLEEWREIPEP